jgi:hypothetical protein
VVLLISIVFALGIAEAADHVCPSSRGEWIDWRESVLRNPSTPYTLAEEVFSFEGCRDRIPNELRSCFGRLFDFARFNHSAVSNLAPPTTFSNRPVDVPSSFRNVGLLKRIVDSDSTVGAQQVAVRELFFGEPGAIGVSYRSSIGPTEDSYVFFQEGSQTE